MKTVQFLILLLLVSCVDPEENYPDKLKQIPNGILVEHSKHKMYAELNHEDPDIYGKYIWKYQTTVSTELEGITIIEFGAYIWRNDEWVQRSIYDRPFNSGEFSKWYSCPEAILEPGKKYTDPKNWSKGDNLTNEESTALWYFIGENKEGKKFKGTSEIISKGELAPEN